MHGGSRTKAAALALALAVVTAACGGGDKKKDAAGDAASDEGTTTTVAGQAPTGETGAPGSGSAGGSAASPGGAPTGSPATTVAPSGGGSPTTTAKAGSSPSATSSKTAAPGRYTYRRTGDQTTPFGPRSLNGEGSLVVQPPNGADQHSATTYTESSSEQTLRHRAGGIDLLYLKIANQQAGSSFEFRPSPPVLFAPDPLAVGATWSWRMTSTNGALTIDASFKVVRNETLDIGGEAVATAVVEGTSQLSGAFTGTLRQTLWGSERYRLIVRTDEATDITAPAAVQSKSSSVLVSTKPA
jgi:hypothetical protein